MKLKPPVRRRCLLVGLLLAAFGLAPAQAKPPRLPAARLLSVFPAGGQAGTTVDVLVNGQDLDDARAAAVLRSGDHGHPQAGARGLGQTGLQPLEANSGCRSDPRSAADGTRSEPWASKAYRTRGRSWSSASQKLAKPNRTMCRPMPRRFGRIRS